MRLLIPVVALLLTAGGQASLAQAVPAAPLLTTRFGADSASQFRMAAPPPEGTKLSSYAMIGLGIGAVVGLIVDTARNMVAEAPQPCASLSCNGAQARLSPPFGTSILIGAGAGFVVGAIVGQRTPDNQYVQIAPNPLARSVSLVVHGSW